jgi:hypothetical protein
MVRIKSEFQVQVCLYLAKLAGCMKKCKACWKILEKIQDADKILIFGRLEAKTQLEIENLKETLHAKFFFQKNAAA